jgi:outer membrane protein OmpA-like peptidoglycan-associated protein
VALVQEWPGAVKLTGHTDSRGPAAINEKVGLGRAWAVQQLLSLQGLDIARLPIASMGERAPIADNATPEGRAANRRVTAEFLLAP